MKLYKIRLKISLSLICTLLLTSVWINAKQYISPALPENNTQETWINVFVHGIMSIKPHLTLSNFMRFMRDDVKNTVYSKTVELMRLNDYFYLNQAMQGFGLKKIDPYNLFQGNATSAIARIYDEVDKIHKPFVDNHFYTFGWSGLLSPTARYKDAEQLFEELTQELEKYWQKNIFPKVRLVGYSHGGNVCLNLGAVRQDKEPLSPLTVDELILIGVPVQTETDYLANDQIFKKIYHIYSHADRIQRIDFFSFNRAFSRRHFKDRHRFKVPKKLTQVQFKAMRSSKTNYDYEKRFARCLNFNHPGIISGNSRLLRDCSPGHLEFWFFGWSPNHYRESFALHPLPAFITLPYIIHHLKHHEDDLVHPHTVIVDIRPEFEVMLIKQRKRNKFTQIYPFISQKQFEHLTFLANKVAVDSSFEDAYFDHIYDAFEKAKNYYKIFDNDNKKGESVRVRRRMRKRSIVQ